MKTTSCGCGRNMEYSFLTPFLHLVTKSMCLFLSDQNRTLFNILFYCLLSLISPMLLTDFICVCVSFQMNSAVRWPVKMIQFNQYAIHIRGLPFTVQALDEHRTRVFNVRNQQALWRSVSISFYYFFFGLLRQHVLCIAHFNIHWTEWFCFKMVDGFFLRSNRRRKYQTFIRKREKTN